jgi:ribosome modulation factor
LSTTVTGWIFKDHFKTKTMPTINDATYWKSIGKEAYQKGKSIKECPFTNDFPEQKKWWEIGWKQAAKENKKHFFYF